MTSGRTQVLGTEAELLSVLPASCRWRQTPERRNKAKLKGWCVYIEALKNLLVSWQFLFQDSSSLLVLASFKFQELLTYPRYLWAACSQCPAHTDSMTSFHAGSNCVHHIKGRFITAAIKTIFKGKTAF